MAGYIAQGEIRGAATGNRGPVRLDEHGKLHADIRNAYREKGFYIFEGLIEAEELDILRAEANNMIDRARCGRVRMWMPRGGAVAWHQDGVTYWESPDWDPGIHGFNFGNYI